MMRNLILIAVLVSLAACSAPTRRSSKSPMQQKIEKMFNAADVDHDEWLTAEELDAGFPWLKGRFAEIDLDRNGKLSLAEVESFIDLQRMLPPERKKPR